MPREKESYRDNLERINAAFPDKELLQVKETALFLGIDPRTAKKWFSFSVHGMISKAVLAREIS